MGESELQWQEGRGNRMKDTCKIDFPPASASQDQSLFSIYFFIFNPLPPSLSPPPPLNLLSGHQFIFISYNAISMCVLLSYWSTILVTVDSFLLESTYLGSLCSTPLFCFVFFYFSNNFLLQILHGLFFLETP